MDGELLSDTFVELADTMVADFDVIDFLHTLTERSVQLLDAAAAGVLLADPRGELRLVAASTEAARVLELFQLQNDQGPCLDCFRTGQVVVAPDLTAAQQAWPQFAIAARQAGFAAVHALPMRLRDTGHRRPEPVPGPGPVRSATRTCESARAWPTWPPSACCKNAARAAVTPSASNCRAPLNSRVVIEQAKGKLASGPAWTWTRHLQCCAATPETTTCACPTWPRPSSTAPPQTSPASPPLPTPDRTI